TSRCRTGDSRGDRRSSRTQRTVHVTRRSPRRARHRRSQARSVARPRHGVTKRLAQAASSVPGGWAVAPAVAAWVGAIVARPVPATVVLGLIVVGLIL